MKEYTNKVMIVMIFEKIFLQATFLLTMGFWFSIMSRRCQTGIDFKDFEGA
jgi:hypothetical protein